MSAIFSFEKEATKKTQIFHIFKRLLFRNVFWETSVGFLKSVVLQLFPKYSQSYVNLNVKKESKIQLPLKSRRGAIVFSIWM